jgi:hypothetical protein
VKRHTLAAVFLVSLPSVVQAQNAVTVASGSSYTYSTNSSGQVTSIASKCPGGSDTKASTSVWSTIIAVCPAFYNSSEGLAADYLIHEMLHSLGLPEYPTPGAKTSQQINDEVRSACGS